MNSREKIKKKRIEAIQQLIRSGQKETEDLVNILIVNFAVTRRTALEEIKAIKYFEDEKGSTNSS